jgi:hypothetical protein
MAINALNGISVADDSVINGISGLSEVMGFALESGGGPPDPTLLWWTLNEGTGTAITSDAGPNGTTNADWSSSTESGSGSCLEFNGTSDGANTDAAINYGGVDIITLSMWVFSASFAGATGTIFESSTNAFGAPGRFSVYVEGGFINFNLGGNTGSYIAHITPPSTSAWHHIALVLNNSVGSVTAYVDGVSVSVTIDFSDFSGAFDFETQVLYLGARNNASRFYSGRIDDARIYNVALTSDEVVEIFNAGAL